MRLLGIFLIIALIGGIAGFVVLRPGGGGGGTPTPAPSSAPESTVAPSTAPTAATDDSSFSGTLTDLLGMGGSGRRCEYDMNENGMAVHNVVYVAPDGRFAGKGTMTVREGNGLTMDVNMSGNREGAKTWMEAPGVGKFGSVINYESLRAAAGSPSTQEVEQARTQMMRKYDFRCAPWTVDESVFVVPSDVTFR